MSNDERPIRTRAYRLWCDALFNQEYYGTQVKRRHRWIVTCLSGLLMVQGGMIWATMNKLVLMIGLIPLSCILIHVVLILVQSCQHLRYWISEWEKLGTAAVVAFDQYNAPGIAMRVESLHRTAEMLHSLDKRPQDKKLAEESQKIINGRVWGISEQEDEEEA